MFEKKYVFETKKTRLVRTLLNVLLFVFIVLIGFTTMCFYIPYEAEKESALTQSQLYKKAPDLIAIYTGGVGRIAFGLEVAKSYPNAKIYISGVYNKNTVETLIEKQVKPHEEVAEKKLEQSSLAKSDTKPAAEVIETQKEIEPEITSDMIVIDYDARNTLENVIYTLHYLRKTGEHRNVLVVSSDYHILRIKWLFNSILGKSDDFQINYLGMKSDFSNLKNLKFLFKEVIKLAQTSLFLMVWDKENLPVD
jgi:uncharacterized SAM-binding protein YcdF (DUF218 family)